MLKPWMKHFYKLHAPETGAEEGGLGSDADLQGSDMDWLFADDDSEEGDDSEDNGAEEDPEPEPETDEPAAEPEENAEPEAEPEADPEPEVEPEAEPEPEAETPDVEQPTDEEVAEKRQQFLAEVEKEFAISEQDANLIISEPEVILPRLAAQIYDKAMRDSAQMMQNMMQQVPQMMTQANHQQAQAQSAQEKFLELNPVLSGVDAKELDTLVESYAPLVAKQFPNATPDEKMQALGRTIAAVKNLTAAPAKNKAEQPVQPHTPAAPVRSGGNQGKPQPANADEAFIDMLIDNQDD